MLKKIGTKFIFIFLTIVIIVSGSGFFISQHLCHECGKSDFYFFEKAHCCCTDHQQKHVHDNLCCDHTCQSVNDLYSHQCKIKTAYFSIPFFPIKKVKLSNSIISPFLSQLSLKTIAKKPIAKLFDFLAQKESPPLLLFKNDFISVSQQRIYYC